MSSCPSDLSLEAYLLSPLTAPGHEHVSSCGRCEARLAEMRRLGEEFERAVFPATVGAITSARSGSAASARAPTPRLRPRWVVLAAPVAAAAVVLFVLLRDGTGRGQLDLTVLVDDGGRLAPVQDGSPVPATAALRFRVEPRSPCNLWVLSVDATGDIARIYPPKGDRVAEQRLHPAASQDLPATAVLDGRAGPARIFAVCTRTPVPWSTVKTAAAEKLGKGDAAVRSYRSIPGLPKGAWQTTVLVEKRS